MGLDKSTKSSKLWSELGKWVFKTFLLLARYESITMKNSLSNSPLKRLSLFLWCKLWKGEQWICMKKLWNKWEIFIIDFSELEQIAEMDNLDLALRVVWMAQTSVCLKLKSSFFWVCNYLFLTLNTAQSTRSSRWKIWMKRKLGSRSTVL